MFLTKKSIRKICIMTICYVLLGSICVALSACFENLGVPADFLKNLGTVTVSLGMPVAFIGWYAEGEGKLINLGMKLVRKELKPAEFIRQYEDVKNANDLVINKPSVEVLQIVAAAYDVLDDEKNTLATADEVIAIASGKKKVLHKLYKVAFLYSYGRTEEAELLFNEIQKQKLDPMSSGLADAILKGDRAKAMGDYKTAEAYSLMLLQRPFPKLDNLGKLITHFALGEVYEKMQDEKAVTHYQYCADFGGETALQKSAAEKLKGMKSGI